MKKLVSILYTASLLLGSFCPMSMASAMQASQPTEHIFQAQEAFMSPSIPMTFAAPMSVAAVAVANHYGPLPMAEAPGGCPGGNCITMDHSQKQEIVVSAVNISVQGGAALPAIVPSIADSLSQPISPHPHTGGSHLANTIATIVLRV